MSGTNDRAVEIGCPHCDTPVAAQVPPGPGIVSNDDRSEHRLRGTNARCHNCGHPVEVYYY